MATEPVDVAPVPGPESSQDRRAWVLEDLKKALAQDLSVMFSGGGITRSKYSQDIVFKDPITFVTGIDLYQAVISFLSLFNVKLVLHSIDILSEFEIKARWSMDMTVRVLPWQPVVSFTGTTQYLVDPDAGLVTQHVDTWDAIAHQDFISIEGVAYVLQQTLAVQLTPQIETPEYKLLLKKGDYEIRSYPAFLVASTQMGASSGPASGLGFTTLAGYIFGGNNEGVSLEMTTPVMSRVLPGQQASTMEFVMERRYTDVSQLPTPKDATAVSRERFEGGTWAVARFSGWPLDHEVVAAERSLRDALFRDGLNAMPGYRLARYNEPTVPPFLRRNEVLIQLEDFEWPPAPQSL